MIGFTSTYLGSTEIFDIISHNIQQDSSGILLMIISGIIIMLSIFFGIPTLYIVKDFLHKDKERKYKKKLLTQILYQKDLEDEIEKEL